MMRAWKIMAAVATAGLLATFAGTAVSPVQSDEKPGVIKIVALGDSLTAGYELPPSAAFPVQLEKALRSRGLDVTVANAGVSGDTTSAGLARLDWAVAEDTDAVILELGANDALRGVDPAAARKNLDRMLEQLTERGVTVLLAGMRSPQNWGKDYVDAFESIYPDLAEKHNALLYPFFMEGALDKTLMLSDGLHPNEAGVARIVEGILPTVEELIERARMLKGASKS